MTESQELRAAAPSPLGTRRAGVLLHVTSLPGGDLGRSAYEFVDWLVEAGYSIRRVEDYGDWLQRFETTLRSLPEKQRNASLLPLLHNYQSPAHPVNGSIAPTDRFRAAVQEAKIGPDKDIPHISSDVIVKYVTDLELLGLL